MIGWSGLHPHLFVVPVSVPNSWCATAEKKSVINRTWLTDHSFWSADRNDLSRWFAPPPICRPSFGPQFLQVRNIIFLATKFSNPPKTPTYSFCWVTQECGGFFNEAFLQMMPPFSLGLGFEQNLIFGTLSSMVSSTLTKGMFSFSKINSFENNL